MLSTAAFNALLKTLEEPPAHVKFMFATTDPEKVLPTILSRCQRFDLRRIPAALITKHLAHIAKLEKVKIDDAALHAIARGADGGMRDAESTLDQLISFCGDKIEEPDVLSMFGLTAQSQILELAPGDSGRRNGDGAARVERTGEERQGSGTAAVGFAESFSQPADFPGFARRSEAAGSFRGRGGVADGTIRRRRARTR